MKYLLTAIAVAGLTFSFSTDNAFAAPMHTATVTVESSGDLNQAQQPAPAKKKPLRKKALNKKALKKKSAQPAGHKAVNSQSAKTLAPGIVKQADITTQKPQGKKGAVKKNKKNKQKNIGVTATESEPANLGAMVKNADGPKTKSKGDRLTVGADSPQSDAKQKSDEQNAAVQKSDPQNTADSGSNDSGASTPKKGLAIASAAGLGGFGLVYLLKRILFH